MTLIKGSLGHYNLQTGTYTGPLLFTPAAEQIGGEVKEGEYVR